MAAFFLTRRGDGEPRRRYASATMRILTTLAAALLASCLPACATAPASPATFSLRLIAFNDFHGHLEPPAAGLVVPDPTSPGGRKRIRAGGIAHMATAIAEMKAGREHAIVVAAGDLVSASPLASSLFLDEPAVKALGEAGLELSSVGNHEFDRGRDELKRLQDGGCHPKEGCIDGPWPGARFRWLAANVIDTATGRPFLPPYAIREFGGVPVAFVGLVLRGTPFIVQKSGIAGLEFRDEVETVKALVPELRAKGVEAVVVLLHEGGTTKGAPFDPACPGFEGPIVDIVRRLDPAVDVVVSGHTHQAYLCRVDGRLVTQSGQYGQGLVAIDLVIDRASRDVVRSEATAHPVDSTVTPARADLASHVAKFVAMAEVRAGRVVGRVRGEFSALANAAGETNLGNLVADAQLAATRDAGAQVAFMNPGGLRAPLASRRADGDVTFGDIYLVQPFGNTLVTMTLTGGQVLRLLEGSLRGKPAERPRLLQVSSTLRYEWDGARPPGSRVVPGSVMIEGKPLDPKVAYRVTVNSFMADGGDGHSLLARGTDRTGGPLDVDALAAYLGDRPLVAGPPEGRITRRDAP